MDTVLVTGGMGCIGAWVLHHLVRQNIKAVNFDLSQDRSRLNLLLTPEQQETITFVSGDLAQPGTVADVVAQHGITHIIHLAALQVPFCRANPVLGAQVNVVGTVNIFEAARHNNIKHVAYASSIAVYGAPEDYEEEVLSDQSTMHPRTLYGVYKVANENTARIYWQDYQISSLALRPYTVYGIGRDQGMTSAPTLAMQAAAQGKDYHIPFGGTMLMQYASDVAQQFIAASQITGQGAQSISLGTPAVSVADVARIIMELRPGVRITHDEAALALPRDFKARDLYTVFPTVYETPLRDGIAETIRMFEAQA
jgi:nucleoside-diphosphate-sugar epimerase